MRTVIPVHLTDEQLLSEAKRFALSERDATAQLVAHLAEIEVRRLPQSAGFSSLFTYCVAVLGLSESEAYNRIEAARVVRRFPAVLAALEAASVNLTTVRLLGGHLTADNHEELLAAAAGRRKREVQELLARRFPRPDVPSSIRKLPAPRLPATNVAAPGPADGAPIVDVVQAGAASQGHPSPSPPPTPLPLVPPGRHHPLAMALAPDRYQIKFTASAATWEKLRLARDLLRHAVPSGDPAEIIDRALSALLQELARKKCAAVRRPQKNPRPVHSESRHVPAAVRRVVWARDRGRCAFISPAGRRCGERAFLEFHHVVPYAAGGEATAENIQLRCRAHNAYEAMLFYGTEVSREGNGKVVGPRRSGPAAPARSGTSLGRGETHDTGRSRSDSPPS